MFVDDDALRAAVLPEAWLEKMCETPESEELVLNSLHTLQTRLLFNEESLPLVFPTCRRFQKKKKKKRD